MKGNQALYIAPKGARPFRLAVLLVLCWALGFDQAQAFICTTTGSGNWNQAATWSCGRAPLPGDTLIILNDHTITITGNHVYNGEPILLVIYGSVQFSGTGSKLTFSCGSFILIQPGGSLYPDPSASGNSETVRICNTTYWSTSDGPQSGPVFWPYNILPVELIGFQGESTSGAVLLTWSTATESQVDQYRIYRSTDLQDALYIGQVQATGGNSGVTHYSLPDRPQQSGLYYYHLVEADADGDERMLSTVAVQHVVTDELLRCWPNPIRPGETLQVAHGPAPEGSMLRMADTAGSWIYERSTTGPSIAPGAWQSNAGVLLLVVDTPHGRAGHCRLVIAD